MKRVWIILLVCALVVGGVYACNEMVYRNFSARYRLTVSVDDNGQLKTGTSVIETRYESPAGFFCFPFCGRLPRFYGHAITIDLGAKGLLFVIDQSSLIDRDIPRDAPAKDRQEWNMLGTLPFRANGYHIHDPLLWRYPSEVFDKLKQQTRPVSVPPLWLPMIARFRDIKNPKTIEEVDPLDLTATLGPGVRFIGATLQITTEPITPTPPTWPKWLADGGVDPEFNITTPDGIGTYELSPKAFTTDLQ